MDASPLLQARRLTKSFAGVRALDGVALDIAPASVHALLGENGAGKSTLMKILAGQVAPDAGAVCLRGEPVRWRGPKSALRAGVAMIHQELLPFHELTVAENIFMGAEPTRGVAGWVDRGAMESKAREILCSLGVDLPPARRLGELGVAEMQVVEIAKALAHRADVILMDEPTSALSEHEVDALLAAIRDLRGRGVAIVYTSHKLSEVFRVADTVTVLRDGRHVATRPIGEVNERRLIAMMVGREPDTSPVPAAPASDGEILLAVRGLSAAGRFQDIRLKVRRGEIVGLAGLMGAGRTELLRAIYGLAPAERGEILVRQQRVFIGRPADAIRVGIGLVTEDRKTDGLVPDLSVKHNLTLAGLRRCCRAGIWIDGAREAAATQRALREFSIKSSDARQPVRELSGGNQQKVVLAKVLLPEPDILLLDEPTRGIDVGAKAEVHALIHAFARAGKAVLLASSELPELLALSHRLLVLREGTLAAELDPRRATPDEILRHAMPR